MAQAEQGKKQRVQVKVFDVATGEEQFSSETITSVVVSPFCCSCSTNWTGPVVENGRTAT